MLPITHFFSLIPTDENHLLEKAINPSLHGKPWVVIESVSAGPDDGANNLCAAAMKVVKRHHSTKEAFENMLSGVKAPEIWDPGPPIIYDAYAHMFCLWGHGSPGGFDTGSGNVGYGYSNRMSLGSYDDWGPIVKDLGIKESYYLPTLRLYSCSTGAEEAGSEFVYTLARAIKCSVKARTGEIIWVMRGNTITGYYELGSTWQAAWFGDERAPDPIPQPQHAFQKKFVARGLSGKLLEDLDLRNAYIATSTFTIYQADLTLVIDFDKQVSEMLAPLLFASPLFENDGQLLAFISMKAVLKFSDNSILTIDIYNNRLGKIRERNCSFFIDERLFTEVLNLS